jgi:hypothetical protein
VGPHVLGVLITANAFTALTLKLAATIGAA